MAYGASTGAGITADTELAVFQPTLWAEAVSGYLRRALVFRGSVDDYSSLVSKAGEAIKIPSISEVTVQDKAENTAVQYDATTESSVTLNIDKFKYASKMFEDIALIQSNGNLVQQYASMLSYAMGKQVDQDICTMLSAGISSGATLSADDTISDAELEAMLASLGEADLDYRQGLLTMVVNPTVYADLLNNPKFVRYDALGASKIASGRLGEIFGIPVEMTNALGTSGTQISAMVYHKSAGAFAMQKDVGVEAQRDIDYLADKVVFTCYYGSKIVHPTRGYKFTNAS